ARLVYARDPQNLAGAPLASTRPLLGTQSLPSGGWEKNGAASWTPPRAETRIGRRSRPVNAAATIRRHDKSRKLLLAAGAGAGSAAGAARRVHPLRRRSSPLAPRAALLRPGQRGGGGGLD